jgi:hypothetical protein
MHDAVHPKRLTRSPRARLTCAATLAGAVLLAACGGSSPSPTAATVGRASTPAPSATRPGAGGSGPLAFAKCMRADGVPNFPDPSPGDGSLFRIGTGINPSSPAVEAAQAKCQKLIGGGPPGPGSTTHPSAQTLAKLLTISRCMRRHGVAGFPDPRTSVPADAGGYREVTDFDGAILLFPSTINTQSPAYKQALTACGAPPLGLPH